jgi:signal transduction histidine kinase
VPADETQVRQLVENLLTNALKYRHPDRPGRIVLRLHRAGRRQCLFEVEDNGIGFDPIHASQIFEPFRRLHSERDYSGTGVGLAICARVCEQHGWTIRGYGRPGAGATFRVSMTVETDAAGADAGPPVP